MISAWIATDIIKSVFDILNESPPTDEEEEGFPWMRNFFTVSRKRTLFSSLSSYLRYHSFFLFTKIKRTLINTHIYKQVSKQARLYF